MAQLSVPVRIRSSSSSTSSLSSTFSDLASSTSTSSSSPPNSKTNAFFASPFSTHPPSPAPPPSQHVQPEKPRSITADFFATSVRPPSPPPSARAPASSVASIPHSSIFPSRYTSSVSSEHRARDFTFISTEDPAPHAYHSLPAHHSRTPSAGSDDSQLLFSSPTSPTFGRPRLPTPPPPTQHPAVHREDTIMPSRDVDMRDEPTPRPAPREPVLLKFERSLLLARQAEPVEAEIPEDEEEEELEPEELKEGSIISLPPSTSHSSIGSPPVRSGPLPISPLALAFTLPSDPASQDRGTPTPTPMGESSGGSDFSPDYSSSVLSSPRSYRATTLAPSLSTSSSHSISRSSSSTNVSPRPAGAPSLAPAPQLRLLRQLGHGAFSAVWLAEDLSRVPLTLVSKKSVRDLRRRASGREREDRTWEKSRDAERDREWEALKDMRAKTPEGPKAELDVTPRPPPALPSASILSGQIQTPTNNAKDSPKRQTSRIREGLRNMLAFSRGASASPTAAPAQASSSTAGPPSSLGVDTSATIDGGDTELSPIDSPMSSSSSVRSVDLGSVSRAASVRSAASSSHPKPPSRASSIRLAPPIRADAAAQGEPDKAAALVRDASLRKFRARVRGTRPALSLRAGRALDERDGEMGVRRAEGEWDAEREVLQSSLARKPSSSAGAGGGGARTAGRLVAVKMTVRRPPKAAVGPALNAREGKKDARQRERERGRAKARREEEERTRVRFVREVEVLKHISHPNITPLLAHLSTATHHILVLPYLPGGDLLGLVNNDIAWGKMSESVLRRIWFELCKAVGWMHGVGLVHRDIKLENILLTTPTFSALDAASPAPTLSALPAPPAPFIKLTDFGLSRFVEISADGEAEPLSTRCGSEAYAAPELVTGGGMYDARKTDAWACGVVLYALVARVLPFGEGVGAHAARIGGERIGGERGAAAEGRAATPAERRHWLMRIARGEWRWPEEDEDEPTLGDAREGPQAQAAAEEKEDEELMGAGLVKSRAARRIVRRLLVRDARKRARIADLWDDAWMAAGGGDAAAWMQREEGAGGCGGATPHAADTGDGAHADHAHAAGPGQMAAWDGDAPEFWKDAVDVSFYDEPTGLDGLVEGAGDGDEDAPLDDEEEEEEEDGCLLDQEGIDSITRQEVI